MRKVGLDQDKFVSINKFTGDISLLAQGPSSSGQDGCACPYTLELQKTVVPEIAYPCTDVVYNFIVSNGSGTGRQGIDLIDTMPLGLTAKEVISNPFGMPTYIYIFLFKDCKYYLKFIYKNFRD